MHAKDIQIFCEQRLHKVNKLSDQEVLEQVEARGMVEGREIERDKGICLFW